METSNFRLESAPSSDSSKSVGKEKGKKIGGIVARREADAEATNQEAPKPDATARGEIIAKSLFQRLAGEEAKRFENTADTPLKDEAVAESVEASPDMLTEQEKIDVAEGYIDARLEAVTDSNTPEDQASKQLLEADQRHLAEGVEVERVPDIAYQEVIDAQALNELDQQEPIDNTWMEHAGVVPPEIPPEVAGEGSGGDDEPPTWWQRLNLGGPGGQPQAPNTSPNTSPKSERDDTEDRIKRATARGLLIGGLIGFGLGKWRGRLKAERKATPIIEKLERQAEAIQELFAEKESRIRTLARQKAELLEAVDKQTIYRPLETSESTPQMEPTTNRIERTPIAPPRTFELPKFAEKSASRPSAAEAVETMDQNELLAVAEKVVVGATTLRRVFETHLISERGLRRAVSEHLRGGNLNKVLSEELLDKELSFERDPVSQRLRDRQSLSGGVERSSNAPSDIDLITEAVQDEQQGTNTSLTPSHASSSTPHHSLRRKLVIANVVALGVLSGLLIVLLIIYR